MHRKANSDERGVAREAAPPDHRSIQIAFPALAEEWIPVTPAFAGAGKHRDDKLSVPRVVPR
jgi:hypothetical protein